MENDQLSPDLTRRGFIKAASLGTLALATGATNMLMPEEAHAQSGRSLISPQEFLRRIQEAGQGNEAFFAVQRQYEIVQSGPDRTYPIRAGFGNPKHVFYASFNIDNMCRVDSQGRTPSGLDAAPTIALLNKLHIDLTDYNGDDIRKPTEADKINFEWRIGEKATNAGIKEHDTWIGLIKHLRDSHGLVVDDIKAAINDMRSVVQNITQNEYAMNMDEQESNTQSNLIIT